MRRAKPARPNGRRALLARSQADGCRRPAFEGLTKDHGRKAAMVGRVGVEPTTSRLSGVRSNHLSYRPQRLHPAGPIGRQAAEASSGVRTSFEVRISSDEGT